MRKRPFAKRIIAVSLCVGLVLSGTGGTTASELDNYYIEEITEETADGSEELTEEAATEDTQAVEEETTEAIADAESETGEQDLTAASEYEAADGEIEADASEDAQAVEEETTEAIADAESEAGEQDAYADAGSDDALTEADIEGEAVAGPPTGGVTGEITGPDLDTEPETDAEAEEDVEDEEITEPEEDAESEEEALQILTRTIGDVTITVSAEEGVIPENANLRVTSIEKDGTFAADDDSDTEEAASIADSEAEASVSGDDSATENTKTYEEIAAQLQNDAEENGYNLLGFLAYDICFVDENGNEVEPSGDVTVTMEYTSPVLPDGIDSDAAAAADVTVMHLEENAAGTVENVVNLTETAAAVVETDEQNAVSGTTTFTTDSFSTFTISWSTSDSKKITCYYKGLDGESYFEITGGTTNITLTGNSSSEVITLDDYVVSIDNYDFKEARYIESSAGNEYVVTKVKAERKTVDSTSSYKAAPPGGSGEDRNPGSGSTSTTYTTTFTFYNNEDAVVATVINSDATVYFVYEPKTIKTEDTSQSVKINLFDYTIHDSTSSTTEDDNNKNANSGINYNHSLIFSQGSVTGALATNKWNGNDTNKKAFAIQGILDPLLEDGYPKLSAWADTTTGGETTEESLKYLFDTESIANSKSVHEGLNHLFTLDENGYYSYESASHFATIAGSTNDFTVYESTGSGFFPFTSYANSNKAVDSKKYTDTIDSTDINHYFGMTISMDFLQTDEENMIYEFTGDDDVWVFVDDVLVLDIGGIHGQVDGSINFSTGEVVVNNATSIDESGAIDKEKIGESKTTIYAAFVKAYASDYDYSKVFEYTENSDGSKMYTGAFKKDNSKHTLTMYYLERGANGSNCKIKFKLPTVPDGSLVVSKTVQGVTDDTAAYAFQLTNTNGEIVSGATYSLLGTEEDGQTDSRGIFHLKAGQVAIFEELSAGNYTVTEIADDTYKLNDFVTYVNSVESPEREASVTITSDGKAVYAQFLNYKADKEQQFTYQKYVKDNGDGSYDLTLDVSGKKGTTSEQVVADIVFVTGNTESELVTAINNQFTGTSAVVEAKVLKTIAADDDYSKAFAEAEEALKSSENKKVIIFLTGIDLDDATLKSVGSVLSEMGLDYFIAVNTDSANNLNDLYSYVPVNAITGFYDSSDSSNDVPQSIVTCLTSIYCTNVVVTDELSEYAEVVSGTSITIKVTDSSGNRLDDGRGTETIEDANKNDVTVTQVLDNTTITATYTAKDKKIVMSFPYNYPLPTDYTFSVTVTIQPTKEAYNYYAEHKSYPTDSEGNQTVGDQGTDAPTNETSSRKPGFYSNASAYVSYSFNGVNQNVSYAKPVIQLNKVYDWVIYKVSASKGTDGKPIKLSGAEFKLVEVVEDETGVETIEGGSNSTVYYGKSSDDKTEEGKIIWYSDDDFTDDTKVESIPAGTYKLQETKAPSGYLLSEVTWTVKVDYMTGITIVRSDDSNVSMTKLDNESDQSEDGSQLDTTVEFIFENEALYTLPSAGGSGIFLYMIAGMLLMMGGALLIFAQRRKILRI